ncbi:MAG: gamma-glutamyltranspeptidase/glutathione hydrolase [Chlamydiales bacterium]|jgi:gamma-glutamyltranspeptidase/glutathione hydrolase
MRGAVATGHPQTSEAAISILEKGGNAFDAILSAAFVACVAEPYFASLGGGGFLLGHDYHEKSDFVYDFFVNTPGKEAKLSSPPKLLPVELQFTSTVQIFNVGMASIAVPGVLKGFLQFYESRCTMELDDLLAPALLCLEEGVKLTEKQAYIFSIVRPVLEISEYGKEIFNLEKNKGLYNPLLKEFLKNGSPDTWLARVYGEGAADYLEEIHNGNGLLTAQDLKDYRVEIRDALVQNYRFFSFVTNPSPSFGGPIICQALALLQMHSLESKDGIAKTILRAEVLEEINRLKGVGGTTHLNVIDANNNAASMSLSTGTSSGYFIPNSGIVLNNMMGEEDLHIGDALSAVPGQRVPSMMSPSFIKKGGKIKTSLGSGGSNRIRSAILQVALDIMDENRSVKEAIEAPRMHFDEYGVLQIEPGFPKEELDALLKRFPKQNIWKDKDMYFGGVHAVTGDLDGWGDSRRDGNFKIIL